MRSETVGDTEKPQKELSPRKRRKLAEKQRKKTNQPKNLWLRRLIALAILAAIAAGVFWFFSTDASDPLTEAVAPVWEPMTSLINDPLGVDWGGHLYGLAFFAISYLGLIMFMLDER